VLCFALNVETKRPLTLRTTVELTSLFYAICGISLTQLKWAHQLLHVQETFTEFFCFPTFSWFWVRSPYGTVQTDGQGA